MSVAVSRRSVFLAICGALLLVGGLAIDFAGRANFGQHGTGDVKQLQQFVVPIARMDIEDQRSAVVTHIGNVAATFG